MDIIGSSRVPRLILDLSEPSDVELMWRLLRDYRPKHVHVGPPCTFWCRLGRFTAVRLEQEWQALRRAAFHHLSLAARIMQWQHRCGRTGSLEQPSGCVSWDLPPVQAMLKLATWQRFSWPSCAYGHRDPGSGRLYLKRQGFLANVDLSDLCVPCTCGRVKHQCVSGLVQGGPRHGERRSAVSGEYPLAMCLALTAVIARRWQLVGPS